MQIQARGVNVKRHTTYYKVSGKWRTRRETVNLAKQGRINGVTVRYGSNDEEYVATLPYSGVRLYDLPVLTENQIRRNRSH